jgi:hypothetical protein
MIKKTSTILVLLLAICTLYGQEIVGTWNGSFTVQPPEGDAVTFRFVIHVDATDEGFASTVDSPDQNSFGNPTDTTTFIDKVLIVKIGEIDFIFTGTLTDSKNIDGAFVQFGQSYDLDLTKAEEQ